MISGATETKTKSDREKLCPRGLLKTEQITEGYREQCRICRKNQESFKQLILWRAELALSTAHMESWPKG